MSESRIPLDGFSRWFYGGTPPDDDIELPAQGAPAASPSQPVPRPAATGVPARGKAGIDAARREPEALELSQDRF